jgi:hypothetical protein
MAVMRFVRSSVPALACAFLSACYNPREISEELQFTHQRPLKANLIGEWVPTPETVRDMQDNGGYVISKHELTLNADGTFSIINMPDWWKTPFGESLKGFESTSGKWEISQDTGGDWVVDLLVGTAIINSPHLRNQSSPYLIHIGVGDPDNGHFMLFRQLK